jgi:fibro-slime domain-containing protein
MPAPFAPARLPIFVVAGLAVSALASGACTFDPGPRTGLGLTNTGHAGSTGSSGNTGSGGGVYISGTGGSKTGAGGGGPTYTPGTINQVPIPSGFTMVDVGAYKTGDPIPANGGQTMIDSPMMGCYQVVGVVRDFRGANEPMGHPDFEAAYSGGAQTPGLVAADLGADRKPVYVAKCEAATVTGKTADCPYGPQQSGKMYFDQWYRTMDGVNMAYDISFVFEPATGPNGGMVAEFDSAHFFPLDGLGFGMTPGQMHNFSFTTELHTKFFYSGGEQFTFTGDDDVWVFINGKLAVDLGGLHPQTSQTIDMDAQAAQLGITKGTAYNIELFHAERHTTESHFRVDTNFVFVDCGTIIP